MNMDIINNNNFMNNFNEKMNKKNNMNIMNIPNAEEINLNTNLRKELKSNSEMRKMVKLWKNRQSARKCRAKKNIYLKNLEEENKKLREEITKYKNRQQNQVKLELYMQHVI